MGREYTIRVQAIVCTDDDGGNAANVSAAMFASRLDVAMEVFAAAGVKFAFDPVADYLPLRSTLVNREFTVLEAPNAGTDAWDHEPAVDASTHASARDSLARLFPGKLVIMLRHRVKLAKGNDDRWRVVGKGSSSGASANYVNVNATARGADIAHEVGHCLQVRHPFVTGISTVADAAERIRQYVEEGGHPKADGLLALDGDRRWVTDTPSDAKGEIYGSVGLSKCGPEGSIPIPVTFSDGSSRTYVLAPDRSLVMSYFKDCPGTKTISPQQARRVRDGLEFRLRKDLVSAKPSERFALSRGGAATAGAVSEVDVALVHAGRIVTAVRDGDGHLTLVVWDASANGDALVRRGSASAGAVKKLAICSAGLGMVVTASVSPTDELVLIVWRVTERGTLVREGSVVRESPASDVAVTLLASTFVGTAARNLDGSLGVDVWRVDADGSIRVRAGASAGCINHAIGGVATPRVTIASLDTGPFVTTVRDVGGRPKSILWRYDDDARLLERVEHSVPADSLVGRIASCGLRRDAVVVAFEDAARNLGVRVHGCRDDGEGIRASGSAAAGSVREVALCALGTHMVVTAVSAGTNNALKHILWQVSPDGEHVTRIADVESHGECTRLAVCAIDRTQFVAVTRNAAGQLELVAWRLLASLGVACTKDTMARLVDRAVRGNATAALAEWCNCQEPAHA